MKKLLLLNFALFLSCFSFSQINDVGALENEILINPFAGSTISVYDGFTPGLNVYNLGSANQDSVIVNTKIDGPGGIVYDETLGPFSINSGDTLSLFPNDTVFFPAWQQGVYNYIEGDYTLTYSLSIINATDENILDNSFTSPFKIQPKSLSLSRLDITNLPLATSFPSGATNEYQSCVFFQDPTASQLCVIGMHFIPHTDTSINDLAGAEIFGNVYSWDDAWIDLNDTTYTFDTITNDAFQNLNLITFGTHYPASNDEVDDPAFMLFNTPFQMIDNQRFLFCLQTFETTTISFGYDDSLNYNGNHDYYNQPVSPTHIDGGWHIHGWENHSAPSIAIWARQVNEYCSGSVGENEDFEVKAFPNPLNDKFELLLNTSGNAKIQIAELSGKVIKSFDASFNSGAIEVDMSEFNDGLYIFKIVLENGKSTQIRVVKNQCFIVK